MIFIVWWQGNRIVISEVQLMVNYIASVNFVDAQLLSHHASSATHAIPGLDTAMSRHL